MRDDHFWSKASLRVFLEKTLSVIFAIFIWINQSELLMVFEQRLNFPSIAHQRLSRFFANTSPSGLPWWPHIRNFMLFKDLYVRAGRVTLWRACAGTGPAHHDLRGIEGQLGWDAVKASPTFSSFPSSYISKSRLSANTDQCQPS